MDFSEWFYFLFFSFDTFPYNNNRICLAGYHTWMSNITKDKIFFHQPIIHIPLWLIPNILLAGEWHITSQNFIACLRIKYKCTYIHISTGQYCVLYIYYCSCDMCDVMCVFYCVVGMLVSILKLLILVDFLVLIMSYNKIKTFEHI